MLGMDPFRRLDMDPQGSAPQRREVLARASAASSGEAMLAVGCSNLDDCRRKTNSRLRKRWEAMELVQQSIVHVRPPSLHSLSSSHCAAVGVEWDDMHTDRHSEPRTCDLHKAWLMVARSTSLVLLVSLSLWNPLSQSLLQPLFEISACLRRPSPRLREGSRGPQYAMLSSSAGRTA